MEYLTTDEVKYLFSDTFIQVKLQYVQLVSQNAPILDENLRGTDGRKELFAPKEYLQVVSKYTTLRLKIYDPAFQFSKATSTVVSLLHNAFKDARGDVTTGVTTPSLRGVDGERA